MNRYIIENVAWLFLSSFLIACIWQVAEIVFYGEIQPRAVDDLIMVIWMTVVVLAYKRGYRQGKGY